MHVASSHFEVGVEWFEGEAAHVLVLVLPDSICRPLLAITPLPNKDRKHPTQCPCCCHCHCHRPLLIPQNTVCKASVIHPSFALALSSILSSLLTTHPWPSAAAAAAAWRSGALLVFGWSLGAAVLEIVFTERVAMADDSDAAPTPPLLAALQHKDPIVQVGLCVCVLWAGHTPVNAGLVPA